MFFVFSSVSGEMVWLWMAGLPDSIWLPLYTVAFEEFQEFQLSLNPLPPKKHCFLKLQGGTSATTGYVDVKSKHIT